VLHGHGIPKGKKMYILEEDEIYWWERVAWKEELNHRDMCFQWLGDESIGEGIIDEVPWDAYA
jgi:hypothetical protein